MLWIVFWDHNLYIFFLKMQRKYDNDDVLEKEKKRYAKKRRETISIDGIVCFTCYANNTPQNHTQESK